MTFFLHKGLFLAAYKTVLEKGRKSDQ